MVPNKILSFIHRRVELGGIPRMHLVTQSLIVELLYAVERQWLVIYVELVGKQFRPARQHCEVADTKYTHHAHSFAVARPVKRSISPVLEPRQEPVFVVIGLRRTCHR